MKRGNAKGPLALFLFLMAGLIVGSFVGMIIAKYSNATIFQEQFTIGTQAIPAVIDLIVVKIAFGMSLTINFGTILGVLMGILMYYKT